MRKIYPTTLLQLLLLLSLLPLSGGAYAQFYNFDSETSGTAGNFSNGWVGTPGTTTVFSWRADNAGTGSGGTGPAVDHTLGNATGIYIYTEASNPAVQGDSAMLESPNLNLAGFTAPALGFWYHMAGGSMGNLYVDVFNGTSWVRDVDSLVGAQQANENSPWLKKTVSLTAFSGTIRVRFRGICGAGFASDMAVDDVGLEELPAHDLAISNPALLPVRYFQYPVPQAANISFGADLLNLGAQSLTNPTLRVTVGSWMDSVSVAGLASGASANVSTANLPLQPAGSYTALYETYAQENDTTLFNNNDSIDFYVTDSVYSRDDSVLVGSLGIGAGTPGILGQNFEIYTTDTLTSVSFFLNGPTPGDTAWVTLHPFTTTPGAVIATTDTFIIPAATPSWYTLNFPCPVVLTPGTYFVGMNETDQNITLGTTPFNFAPNTGWVIFAANPWRPSEFYGFSVTYLLRMNFGDVSVNINAGVGGSDSTCVNAGLFDLTPLITGGDPGGSWNDDNGTGALSGTMVDPAITGPGTFSFSYGIADSCGIADSATVTLTVVAEPNPGQSSTIGVCSFDAAFDLTPLLGGADPGGSWNDDNGSGALSGSTFDPATAGPGTFNFTYSVSSALCNAEEATITVVVNICPAIDPSVPLSFNIYPNPNNGIFHLEAPGAIGMDLNVRVTDLAGHEVYTQKVLNTSGIMEVDLSSAATGLYIVELSDGLSRMQGRLIKE